MLHYSQANLTISSLAVGGDVQPYRILKFAPDGYAQASANTDALAGVSTAVATAEGERIEVEKLGLVPVVYGGVVSAGDLLTSDASGRAVRAVAGAAALQLIGIAQEDGDEDEIGSLILQPGQLAAIP